MENDNLIVLSDIKFRSLDTNDIIGVLESDCYINFTNDSQNDTNNDSLIQTNIANKCNEILNDFTEDMLLYNSNNLILECNVYVDIIDSFSESYKICYRKKKGIFIL